MVAIGKYVKEAWNVLVIPLLVVLNLQLLTIYELEINQPAQIARAGQCHTQCINHRGESSLLVLQQISSKKNKKKASKDLFFSKSKLKKND